MAGVCGSKRSPPWHKNDTGKGKRRLTFGPKVVWTASASISTPRSIAARASVPNAISLAVAKPLAPTHWRTGTRPSIPSLLESILTLATAAEQQQQQQQQRQAALSPQRQEGL